MSIETAKIERDGRVLLPQHVLDALGITSEEEVVIELTDTAIVLRPKQSVHPITDALGKLSLPVSDWPQMEQEIVDGHIR